MKITLKYIRLTPVDAIVYDDIMFFSYFSIIMLIYDSELINYHILDHNITITVEKHLL